MKIINWIKENKVVVTILLIGAILRFFRMDYQSVWLDEIHTLNEANPNISLSEVYNMLLVAEPHPPLYFILVHYLFVLFGYTTFVLRFFSAVVGILGILSIYFLGKEIMNKKVGLFAAILVTVNPFHLNYSQDGRMYALLFLATTVSFIYLIRFLKAPSIKSGLIYAITATLMIYCHFFALFALFSQYLIFLYFLIYPSNIERKRFFKYLVIAGITTLILYLPAYKLFLRTTEMTSIWIQMPTLDVYTQILKDFFGQSEMVLFFIVPILFFFFIKLFNKKQSDSFVIDPEKDKLVFGFFILFVWILITLFLPLVRTYTSLPMLINRYFINILPAVLVIIALGIFFIKNKTVQYSIVFSIVVFSITDIVVVKKYYHNVSKTQFREVSQFLIDNNEGEPVVSSVGWYFNYFLNNGNTKTEIIEQPLENYVAQMMQDSTKRKSFWYVDGHNKPYKVSEQVQKYLDDNFIVENNLDLFDTWTKHYTTGSTALTTVDISKYQPLKSENGDKIKYWIESFDTNNKEVNCAGWCYLEEQEGLNSNIQIVLISDKVTYKLNSQKIKRGDITKSVNGRFNLDNSGFVLKVKQSRLEKGNYRLGIIIKNTTTNKEGLVITDKTVTI